MMLCDPVSNLGGNPSLKDRLDSSRKPSARINEGDKSVRVRLWRGSAASKRRSNSMDTPRNCAALVSFVLLRGRFVFGPSIFYDLPQPIVLADMEIWLIFFKE